MDNNRQRSSVKLQKGFIVYIFVFIAALLFSQALRNPISGVLLLFVFLAPIVSFIIALIGSSVIQVYVSADTARCEKHAKVNYEIRVINQSFLSYPFVEAVITQPREDGVRCLKKKILLSLAPLGGYIIKKEVSFCYRGFYEIGVSELYISDMLRLFRIRVDIDNYSNVLVYPRYLDIKAKEHNAYTELPSTHAPIKAQEIAEASNIREYQMGDSQKSIHWKLSSKTEELQVKDYSINQDRNIYIFADLAAPSSPPEVKVENTAEALIKLLTERDKRKIKLKNPEELSAVDKAAATAAGKVSFVKKIFRGKRRDAKRERDAARGVDENTLDTVALIDRFIDETSNLEHKRAKAEKLREKGEKLAEKEKKKNEIIDQVEAEEEAQRGVIDKLYEDIQASAEDATRALSQKEIAFGGKVKDEYADDMAEFCADGIVEIALSAAKNELQRGNKVTLVWYDRREDRGFSALEITGVNELEYAFERFSAAPCCESEKNVSDLTRIVDETINVSLKFVTANIDPYSISALCDVPAMFGGAGAGCSCEVILFNPEQRYESPSARLEYAQAARERFISSGVRCTEFKYLEGFERPTLVSLDF